MSDPRINLADVKEAHLRGFAPDGWFVTLRPDVRDALVEAVEAMNGTVLRYALHAAAGGDAVVSIPPSATDPPILKEVDAYFRALARFDFGERP